MKNWNHGATIVNRYSFYIGSLIFCIVLHYLQNNVRNNKFTILLIFIFLTQLSSIVYHFKINLDEYNSAKMKPYAAWVLNKYPTLYNPAPHIFYNRVLGQGELNIVNSPVVWLNVDVPTKLLVHTSKIDDLLYYGFSSETIFDLKKMYASEKKWIYIPNDKFPKNRAFSIACRLNYINIGMKNIASNFAYYTSLCKKAESLNKSCISQIMDEVLWGYRFENPLNEANQLDKKYINSKLDFTSRRAQEYFESELYLKKVELLIDTIEQNKETMDYIKNQASERNITIEEAVFNNAKYLLNQREKK